MSSTQSLPLQGPSFSHRRPSIFSLFPEVQDDSPKYGLNSISSEVESTQSGFDGSTDTPGYAERESLGDQCRKALRLRLAACASGGREYSNSSIVSESMFSNIEYQPRETRKGPSFSIYNNPKDTPLDEIISSTYAEQSGDQVSSPSLSSISSESILSPENSSSKSQSASSIAPARRIYLDRPPSPEAHEWPKVADLIRDTLDPFRPECWFGGSLARKTQELWFYGVGRNTPTFLSPASSISIAIREEEPSPVLDSCQPGTQRSINATNSNPPYPRPTSPPPSSHLSRIHSSFLPLTRTTLAIHNSLNNLTAPLPTLLHQPIRSSSIVLFLTSPNYKALLLLPLSTILRTYDFWTPPKSASNWNTAMSRFAAAWSAAWSDMALSTDFQTTAQWLSGEVCFGNYCCGACFNCGY